MLFIAQQTLPAPEHNWCRRNSLPYTLPSSPVLFSRLRGFSSCFFLRSSFCLFLVLSFCFMLYSSSFLFSTFSLLSFLSLPDAPCSAGVKRARAGLQYIAHYLKCTQWRVHKILLHAFVSHRSPHFSSHSFLYSYSEREQSSRDPAAPK